LIFIIGNSEVRHKAKPKGVANAVIFYEIRGVPPANQDGLARSVFTGRMPYHVELREEDRGKLYMPPICWQNTKGDT
jgi:hypothetical protein